MKKRILLLNGHPVADSFVEKVCASYGQGASGAGHDVRVMNIADMDFDINLNIGHRGEKSLEADLLTFQNNLTWCDHFVLAHPLWWGSVPAKTKGLIDRALLPGFAFDFEEGASVPTRLMKGKTAQVIVTSDTPNWYLKLIYRESGFVMMRKQVLEYCGFGPVKFKHYAPIQSAGEQQREKWLADARAQGIAAG